MQLGFNSNLTELKNCLCHDPPHHLCLAFAGQEKVNDDSTDETSEKMHFTTRADKLIFLISAVSKSWLVCGYVCSYFFKTSNSLFFFLVIHTFLRCCGVYWSTVIDC